MAEDRNPMDELADRLADELAERVDKIPEASVPFGARKLSKAEQLLRYMEVRENPDVWMRLIDQQGMKDTIAYAQTMERELAREIDGYSTAPSPDAAMGLFGSRQAGDSAEV